MCIRDRVSIALSAQFILAMVNSLERSDITPVLCLIGFYSVKERKRNATRSYLFLLCISVLLDVIWLSVKGPFIYSHLQVSAFSPAEIKNNHLLEFVFMCSVVLLVVKMLSAIAVYKFYMELESQVSAGNHGFGPIGGDAETTENSTLLQQPTSSSGVGYQNVL
eukprot:TRINITY_DN11768_c0_g1_i1.p1 TRINITY_DN11768_c0_g1~~TRINITY_DN11768_c0_g1_i1.p1  ORF type:complete len:164 (-),score=37.52 TRINITY_DN11768_c0_g1_i1:382-873(-)